MQDSPTGQPPVTPDTPSPPPQPEPLVPVVPTEQPLPPPPTEPSSPVNPADPVVDTNLTPEPVASETVPQPDAPADGPPIPVDQSNPPAPIQKGKIPIPTLSFPIHNKMFLVGGVISIFLFFGGGLAAAYAFIITPKVNTVKFVADFQPKVSSLKTSIQLVDSSLEQLHQMATEELPLSSSNPTLKTDNLDPSQQLAQKSNTLTASTLLTYISNLAQFHAMLQEYNPHIAGTQDTSETASIQRLRAVKDQTTTIDSNSSKAQEQIKELITLSSNTKLVMSNTSRAQIASSGQIQTVFTPYFTEVQKVAKYYQTLSDTLITMSTKIDSFKVSLASALIPFSGFNSQTSDINSLKANIATSQTFLEQADSDIEELNKLSETLQNIPQDSLPTQSQEYHNHNIKAFTAVKEYFTTQTTLVKGYLIALNAVITKSQSIGLTSGDLQSFQIVEVEGALAAQKADAKFISDLQSLASEEKTLEESFWQNDQALTTGKQVEQEIDGYNNRLNTLIAQNKVPLFTK